LGEVALLVTVSAVASAHTLGEGICLKLGMQQMYLSAILLLGKCNFKICTILPQK